MRTGYGSPRPLAMRSTHTIEAPTRCWASAPTRAIASAAPSPASPTSRSRAPRAVALCLDEQCAEGRAAMQSAVAAAPALSERERRHVEALSLWVGGRAFDAIAAMRAILADHPRDVVVLQRLYFTYFWQG